MLSQFLLTMRLHKLFIVGTDIIVDFEVVGTLMYNGLSGFALKKL